MGKISLTCINTILVYLLFLSFPAASEEIAHWNFNSIDEDRVIDSTKKYRGLLKGSASDLLQQGLYGLAYHFEGGTSVWIEHNDTLSLKNNFTIEVVIKPFKTEGYNTIIFKADRKANPDEINYVIDIRDGKPELKAKDDKDNWYVWATRVSVIEANKWYKIILTFSDGKVRIIINGEEQEVVPAKPGLEKLKINKHKLLIGNGENGVGGSDFSFAGLIDEIKIHNGSDFVITPELMIDIILRTLKMNFFMLGSINDKALKSCSAYYFDCSKGFFLLKNINVPEIKKLNKDALEHVEFLKATLAEEKIKNDALFRVLGKQIKNKKYDQIFGTSYSPEVFQRFKETGHKTSSDTESLLAEMRFGYSMLKNINTRAFQLVDILAAEYLPGSESKNKPDKINSRLLQYNDMFLQQIEMLEEIANNEKYYNSKMFAAIEKIGADAKYNSLFTRDDKFILTVLPVYKRLFKKSSFLADLDKISSSVDISMAGNEYEGFQVVIVGNPQENLSNIQISINDLVHSDKNSIIKGSNISCGLVEYILTEKPLYTPVFVGRIPDPIFEPCRNVTVNTNDFSTLHFRIYAPPKTRAGIYSGSIKFSIGSFSSEIKVTTTIFDFTLPKKNSIKAVFSFWANYYQSWYDFKELTDDQKMYIYDFFLKYRIPPNNIYSKDIYPEIKFI